MWERVNSCLIQACPGNGMAEKPARTEWGGDRQPIASRRPEAWPAGLDEGKKVNGASATIITDTNGHMVARRCTAADSRIAKDEVGRPPSSCDSIAPIFFPGGAMFLQTAATLAEKLGPLLPGPGHGGRDRQAIRTQAKVLRYCRHAGCRGEKFAWLAETGMGA